MKNKLSKTLLIIKKNISFFWNVNFVFENFVGKRTLIFLLFFFVSFNFISFIIASTNFKGDKVTIRGQIKKSSRELTNLEGLDVVLLKYVLNKNGEVTPIGPQKRVKTTTNGEFRFDNVISDFQAGFQLGTRFENNLYSSKIFFMKEGDKLIENNIVIPKISYSVDKLKISKISIVIESGLGKVFITEILVFKNSSRERINTKNHPIKYKLPEGIQNFRMLTGNSKDMIKHKTLDNILNIEHIFQTGNNQIVYQYSLPARFGSLEINREFDHSLDIVGIFTPVNRLRIRSDMIVFTGEQKFNQTTFLSWNTKASDLNRLDIKISKVPQTYFQYFIVTITLLFLFFCIILLFFKKKLAKGNL